MRNIIVVFLLFITTLLSKQLKSQVVYEETFDVPNKGAWADSLGVVCSDFSEVGWSLDYTSCSFVTEGDYAKTVSTSGGRFEVLDSDGEAIWRSPAISISGYSTVQLSLTASETGSNTSTEKKYLKAFYLLDGSLLPFSPDSVATGNWGEKILTAEKISGKQLQIVVKMNSSYANDKVILDDISVEATDTTLNTPDSLAFLSVPQFMINGQPQQVSAVVLNKEGSQITDKQFNLNFESEDFTVSNNSFTDGVYLWTIVASTSGNKLFSISMNDSQVSALQKTVKVFSSDNIVYQQDFESSDIDGWSLASQWELSTVEPISGNQSIKHIEQTTDGTSAFTYRNNGWDMNESDYFFSFKLKNGNWDPSSSNSFYVIIDRSTQVTDDVTYTVGEGFAIGVNATGSSDYVSLWKVEDGVPTDLLIETRLDWNESTCARLDFSRETNGLLTLNATNLTTGESFTGDTTLQHASIIDEIALHFNYSQTRSGQLWFDDLLVVSSNTGPELSSAEVIETGKIELSFTEAVSKASAILENFKLTGKSGTNYTINQVGSDGSSTVTLSVEGIEEPFLTATAFNIEDLDGATTDTTSISFEYVQSATEHNIVINEIMADPTPVVGLPDAEYIELYNRSSKFINLSGLKIKVKTTEKSLPDSILYPESFAVLYHPADSALVSSTSSSVLVPGLPTLLNAGTSIVLSSDDGTVIDSITYSSDWYYDSEKDNGGWSLERISPDRFCDQPGNWSASTDQNGGTPGSINSIFGDNDDTIAPYIVSVQNKGYTQIEVQLSEDVDSTQLLNMSNWSIAPDPEIDSIGYDSEEHIVSVTFKSNITNNTTYELTIYRLTDYCGNISEMLTSEFSITLFKLNDVLISEVLFNPVSGGSDFVELYNNTDMTFDVSRLIFATRDDSMNLQSVYPAGNTGTLFKPGNYLAFTEDEASISANYTVKYPDNIIEVENLPAMNDTEGRIVVLSDSMVVLDEFVYNEDMHSNAFSTNEGVSLERLSFTEDTNAEGNWYSASSLAGYATPGYANSQTEISAGQKTEMTLSSDVISPNGDGYNDDLTVSFNIDEAGYLVNLYVFNVAGKEVSRLTNNDLIGNNNSVTFDCRKSSGMFLPLGTYILFAELLNSNGKKESFKKAFLITDRK